ncbi:unnamed protein product [Sphagnum compactum]
MLLKLCFDAHCLVVRFPGCPMLRGEGSCEPQADSTFKILRILLSSVMGFFNVMQVEELQWELFRQLLQFVPSSSGELQQQVPGVVYLRRCVLSLWKGPRSIHTLVWDFFTGKASGVFLCISFLERWSLLRFFTQGQQQGSEELR